MGIRVPGDFSFRLEEEFGGEVGGGVLVRVKGKSRAVVQHSVCLEKERCAVCFRRRQQRIVPERFGVDVAGVHSVCGDE